MAKPRKRQITIKEGNKSGEGELHIKFSTEDQDAGVTSDKVVEETIAFLQNLQSTGKVKPVLITVDNLSDSE